MPIMTKSLPAPPYIVVLDNDRREICIETGSEEPTDCYESENGKSSVEVTWASDGLPIVQRACITNEHKYSLLIDWLGEAIAAALPEEYGDDHYLGVNHVIL